MINCTGPNTDLTEVRDPLVGSLRVDGTIRPDPLGLGLDTDDEGRLIDAEGDASERLSLAGPLRKGRLWEHTAVPELRRRGAAARRATLRAERRGPTEGRTPGRRSRYALGMESAACSFAFAFFAFRR